MKDFNELGLIEPILRRIQEEKFEQPSEIQEKSIPYVVKGEDVIAGSATGSGKTLAFASGIIQLCEKGQGLQALVLTPTRELAEQVAKTIKKFSQYKPLSVTAIYGGVAYNPQIKALKHADVCVGTPGRILDHLQQGQINLSKVKILTLDEADRMLDMGFIDDVSKIASQCPKDRQTLLFSATLSEEIQQLSKKYMKHPKKVSVECLVDPRKLRQIYYDIGDKLKFSLLVHLLKQEESGLVMVFCNSRKNTDFVAKNLKGNGIEAQAIHGGFSQAKRNRVMEKFHASRVYVLVCTDVAARGLDIQGVSHVYNYDIPADSKQYIHRIGRTARAGKEGIAINIVASRDYENFDAVLRNNDVEIPKEDTPKIERAKIQVLDKPGRRGGPRGGGRFSNDRSRGPQRGGDRRSDNRQQGRRRSGSSQGVQRRQGRSRQPEF